VIVLVELQGVKSCPVVHADNHCHPWSGGSEEGGDCFLDCMEFGVIHLGSIAKVTASFRQPIELLVTAVEDCPSTPDGPVLEFGAVGVDDNGVVR
jgi:hypothetical protein